MIQPLANCLKFHTEGKMNLKQKKEYMAPEMEVVEMGYQTNLLDGSPDFDPDNAKEYGEGTGTGEFG
jgi:hypothetical protein